MATGDRLFTREHVTVLSFDTETSMLTQLGEGTLTKEVTKFENKAVKDSSGHYYYGPYTYTFVGELAGEAGRLNWFTRVGTFGTLTFTSNGGSVTGQFGVDSAALKSADAMRWTVRMTSNGDVTES
jgi:hypothetical protein